ncbi:hypothetical protein [Micromonospora coriariae]|nr:hypothetical protein [Micromonospora coriariae]
MSEQTVVRCGDRLTTITDVQIPPTVCRFPAGHAGWHMADTGAEWSQVPAADLPLLLLAAVDNALRNGSYMTGANVAFNRPCERLGIDRDARVFRPDWAPATDSADGSR